MNDRPLHAIDPLLQVEAVSRSHEQGRVQALVDVSFSADAGQTLGFAMLRATSAAYGWPIFRQKEFPRAHLDAAALRPLAGTYAFEGGLKVRVTYDEAATQITAHFPNGDAYPLTPTGPRSFVHAIDAKQIAFEGDGQIQIDDMTGIREAS